jgi:hypothetical protein
MKIKKIRRRRIIIGAFRRAERLCVECIVRMQSRSNETRRAIEESLNAIPN